ncbi:DedA family protein [Cellulomonas wangsupingiae]|uniref:DedA family protein n=1 Tax=Cellulomonas wangsupingiae TaxID=2968085 RepID=A0ABY5K1F6_9CELL|nr:DedA family protein [Cellulomonas wangsupingiae]MCC2335936.1 DedA family protein [Cellulomonas wangsupingiae]MCM0639775.1 DedA family protein [Cellulomonas wangsupingiae]UUI64160.1 DedA family protein [Cellulomonas wangsupingiae]
MLEQWALDLAGSPWVFAVLLGMVTVDGIFPPVPSESIVIALASLSMSTGSPVLWAVIVVGALGAFTGDQIAYQIGTAVPIRRLRMFRGRRGHAVLDWAEHALRTRGAAFIIGARYVPIGRVAVNMTAGALRFPRGRFVLLTGIAAVTWALYATAIGVGTGAVLGHSPLTGVVVGVVGGFVIGLVVDWVMRRWLGVAPPELPGPDEPGDEPSADVPGAPMAVEQTAPREGTAA